MAFLASEWETLHAAARNERSRIYGTYTVTGMREYTDIYMCRTFLERTCAHLQQPAVPRHQFFQHVILQASTNVVPLGDWAF